MIEGLGNITPQKNPEAIAGMGGAMFGLIAGTAVDVYYLEHPSETFNHHIDNFRWNMYALQQIRSGLPALPKNQREVVKRFLNHDVNHEQAQLTEAAAHAPAQPDGIEEGGVILGAAVFFGMAAVTVACVVRERRRERNHKRRSTREEHDLDAKAAEIMENEFERLEAWLPRQDKN